MLRWAMPTSRMRFGVAEIDVTPAVGFPSRNWALSESRAATGVHRPIRATATVMTWATDRAAVVSLDLGWWRTAADEARVRDAVLASTGLTAANLLIHLIHTHAGPYTHPEEGTPEADAVRAFLDALATSIAGLIEDAEERAVEAELTWGVGRCSLAVNRDLSVGDRDVIAFNPGMPADDTVVVIRVTAAADGALLGTIVNYACHPTTLSWTNSLFSPDWVGSARQLVEEATGATCMILQGASGDLSPRDQATDDLAVAERNGRQVGYAVLATLEGMTRPGTGLVQSEVVESGAPLGLWTTELVDGDATFATAQARVKLDLRVEPANGLWRPETSPAVVAERTLRRSLLADGYLVDGSLRHPLWVWRIGAGAIVAHPGEAYSALQIELRRRHPELPILVLNCTNGPGFVYLPPASAYERDRYEVWQTLAAAGSLEGLIDAADAAVTSLFEGAKP